MRMMGNRRKDRTIRQCDGFDDPEGGVQLGTGWQSGLSQKKPAAGKRIRKHRHNSNRTWSPNLTTVDCTCSGAELHSRKPFPNASSRNGSGGLSSTGQESQPLFVIHGLPRDKFLGKHVHPAKKSQLDEKLEKIQVAKDQGP